jgi:four helix bundle protein
MALDHERWTFIGSLSSSSLGQATVLDGSLKKSGSTAKHLDDASQSIANHIAEGNGKGSRADRLRFLELARGSVLEGATCLDALKCTKASQLTSTSTEVLLESML